MLRGELIGECGGAQQCRVASASQGGSGGDPALIHPMAIGVKHPQQCTGCGGILQHQHLPTVSWVPAFTLLPMEKWLLQ